MRIGSSIVLIAVGAILRSALTLNHKVGSTYVNWNIVGDVLMAAGVVGLVMSMFWMAAASRRGTTVADDRPIDATNRPYVS